MSERTPTSAPDLGAQDVQRMGAECCRYGKAPLTGKAKPEETLTLRRMNESEEKSFVVFSWVHHRCTEHEK